MDWPAPDSADTRDVVIVLGHVAGWAAAVSDQDDADTLEQLRSFYAIVQDQVAGAGGTLVKFMGDAFLSVFPGGVVTEAAEVARTVHVDGTAFWSQVDAACVVQTRLRSGSLRLGWLDGRKDVAGKHLNAMVKEPWSTDVDVSTGS